MQFFNGNYIPPNPIGNAQIINNTPTSNFGYMGGFYTNNYGYHNPFLEEERRKQDEIKRREQLRYQCDVLKTLSMSVNKSLGNNISTEYVDNLYEPMFDEQPTEDEFEKNYEYLTNMYYHGFQGNPYLNQQLEKQNQVYEYRQTLVPKDCDLYEFMDKSVNLIDEIEKDEARERNAEQIAMLYNKKSYKSLVDLRSGEANNFFSNTFDNNFGNEMNTDIDDMEVHFPAYRNDEDSRRRAEFMQKVLDEVNSRGSGGV